MKTVIATLIFNVCLLFNVRAQTPTSQASQIAQKMKDSLSLTSQQQNQIEVATVSLQTIQAKIKSIYISRPLRYYLSLLETERDSTYYKILPSDKYLLYLKKKSNLISSN